MPSVSNLSEPTPAASSGYSSPARNLPPLPNELLLASEEQWIFSEFDLQHTPSVVAGLSPLKERENRAKGVNFILQVGIMLKLPQLTLASAAVFLHRFFMRLPMVKDHVQGRKEHHHYSVAATCLFLATKVEENCRKMKDLVVACVRVAQKQPSKAVDEQDKEFWLWRDTILTLEDVLLEALCFDLTLEPPHAVLFDWLVYFDLSEDRAIRNAAWAFVNDGALTPLCLLWPSRTIAATAIYAAARCSNVRIPDDQQGRPWWRIMDVDLKEIRRTCNFMTRMYEVPPLKGGSGAGEGMYTLTPEDGDELHAKTRLVQPGLPEGGEGAEFADEKPGSETSRKRSHTGADQSPNAKEESQQPSWGGEGRDEEASKRRKVSDETSVLNGVKQEMNGVAAVKAEQQEEQQAPAGGGLLSPKLERGSEEGELES